MISKTFYINLKLFTWGLFFSKTSSLCPSAVCTCPLPLVGQNLAENEKKQVKVFNLISNTPRPQKNLIARHQDYLVCLKSKPMKCYLRHQRTGESLGGVLIFFPWVCNSQNATQFLEGDLEKGKGFREKRFHC